MNDVISGQCVLTSLHCFHIFFQLHHDQISSLHCISFFPQNMLLLYIYIATIVDIVFMPSLQRAEACAE